MTESPVTVTLFEIPKEGIFERMPIGYPVKSSNGNTVYQQLEERAKITGVPREIVADHGPDIKTGVEKFCNHHKKTVYVYLGFEFCKHTKSL